MTMLFMKSWLILLVCCINLQQIKSMKMNAHHKAHKRGVLDRRGWFHDLKDQMKKLFHKFKGDKAAQGQGEVKQCHSDWIAGPNGACYYLPANPEKTWGDFFFAQNSCHDKGGADNVPAHAISIESAAEQKFIEEILDKYPDTDFWTSGNRISRSPSDLPGANKIWRWFDDEKPIESQGFTNWDEGQPQWENYINFEECIFLGHKSLFNLKWHDHRCSYNTASYICEYNLEAESKPEPEPEPEPEEKLEDCHSGWISGPNGACYYVPSNPHIEIGTFFAAQKGCSDKGEHDNVPSHAISIESLEEQNFIEDLLSEYPDTDFWTSGNRLDAHGATTRIWHWFKNEQPIESQGYVNWDEDNMQPGWESSYGEEACIFLGHMSRFKLKWHDHQCSFNTASFVCEYSRNTPDNPSAEPEAKPSSKPQPEPEPETDDEEVSGSGSGAGYAMDDEDMWEYKRILKSVHL